MALSPFRRLPLDILQEIALWSPPETPSHRRTDVPVSLSQVSSGWRTAVLSLPTIWARLEYDTYGDNHEPGKLSRLLEQFFSKARDQPLSLSLGLSSGWSVKTKADYDLKLSRSRQALAEAMHGCPLIVSLRHLSISSAFPMPLLVQEPIHLPQLESLVLTNERRRRRPASDQGLWTHHILKNNHKLRSLLVDHSILGSDAAHLLAPWTNALTHFSFAQVMQPSEWLDFLNAAPNLQSGYFHVSGSLPLPDITPTHAQLEELTLVFRRINPESFKLWKAFRFSRVRHLTIKFPEDPRRDHGAGPPWHGQYHLDANFPNLQVLTFDEPWNSRIFFPEFCQHNPGLLELRIAMPVSLCGALFTRLSLLPEGDPSQTHGQLLPRITNLTVLASTWGPGTGVIPLKHLAMMETMLESRVNPLPKDGQCSTIYKLQSFRLICVLGVQEEVRNELRSELERIQDKFQAPELSISVDFQYPAHDILCPVPLGHSEEFSLELLGTGNFEDQLE
ncbi:hypothetical protein NLJ89_g1551 [Agrocybe chaxingu]|uniref:F-box domain-containing protein n=1 Tax=Agrocybe chaxingu TaxID=84603 RepID=A0A9W8MZV3_9AGAR|nr:hypothetical protein NLJ89_g1551 [Agrocybe chaxingu]